MLYNYSESEPRIAKDKEVEERISIVNQYKEFRETLRKRQKSSGVTQSRLLRFIIILEKKNAEEVTFNSLEKQVKDYETEKEKEIDKPVEPK